MYAAAIGAKKIIINELEKLPQNLTTEEVIERLAKSKTLDTTIAETAFTKFIELISIKLLESPKSKFPVPLFGTFEIKIHKGHKITQKNKNEEVQYMVHDYPMLRFSPDDKLKVKILGEQEIKKTIITKDSEK